MFDNKDQGKPRLSGDFIKDNFVFLRLFFTYKAKASIVLDMKYFSAHLHISFV